MKDLKDAVCLAVNHRYRLMAFGCKSGAGVVYVVNEVEGTMEVSYNLEVQSKDYPDAAQTAGSVNCMKWTPDGTALALCWKNGGYSLWSVFGSLLVCSLAGEYSFPFDGRHLFPCPVKAMEWGLEGYQLWMICTELKEIQHADCNDNTESSHVMQLHFVKSALTVNPCSANHEHVFLQGEDKIYINIGDTSQKSSQSVFESRISIGNKLWQMIPISHSYLATNWPIRVSFP